MNITRAELKKRAKGILTTHYWQIFAALMIYKLVPAIASPSMNFIMYTQNMNTAVAFVLMLGVMLFSLAVSIFLISPLYMAVCRFVIKSSTEAEVKFSVMWLVLKENYFNLVKAGFRRDIFLLLWSLPYIAVISVMTVVLSFVSDSPIVMAGFVLGIIVTLILILYKSYSYSMVNYIMAEYPETSGRDAIAESKRLMRGRTFFAFMLDLSFIGWQLLGLLACGIGISFVQPYIASTQAQFYMALKEEKTNIF